MHQSITHRIAALRAAFSLRGGVLARPGASPLVAVGLSLLLAVAPLAQPAAAQSITVQPGVSIQGTPMPVSVALTPTPSGAAIPLSSCGGAQRIFQNCPIGGLAESRLEAQAIDALLALHQLPASDRARVLTWARDDVRAMLFENLIAAYKKDPGQRSADETAAIAGLTKAVRDKRVRAATVALDEYKKWGLSPCTYQPPSGFSYDRDTVACPGSNVQLYFGAPQPPTRSEFVAYGATAAYGRYDLDAVLKALSANTAKSLGTIAGLGAAAGAGVVGAYAGANITVGTLAAVQPFIIVGVAKATGVSTTVASGTAAGFSGVISVAGPVTIIALAIVIGVVQGINVFTAADIPGKLQDDFRAAQSYDPSSALRSSDADTRKAATQELYAAFLELTLPDYPANEAAPAPQPSDTKLVIHGVPTSTLQYLAWDNSRHTARLNGGWWVDTDASGKEQLTLGIDYLDHSGQRWTASRVGNQFWSVPGTPAPTSGAAPMLSTVLDYQNWQAARQTATLQSATGTTPATSATPTAAAQPALRISIEPSSATLAVTCCVGIDVKVPEGVNMPGPWITDIVYDPKVVRVASCSVNIGTICDTDTATDAVRLRVPAGVFPRSASVASLSFGRVGATGSSSTLGVRVTDATGKQLPATVSASSIKIQ